MNRPWGESYSKDLRGGSRKKMAFVQFGSFRIISIVEIFKSRNEVTGLCHGGSNLFKEEENERTEQLSIATERMRSHQFGSSFIR
jgi:hypothetical protein